MNTAEGLVHLQTSVAKLLGEIYHSFGVLVLIDWLLCSVLSSQC